MPKRWRALVLLAATTSLRWGELMALTGADLDLDRGTVRVMNAVSEVNGKIVVGPPTFAAGRRTVAVLSSVLPLLRAHVESFSEAGARGRVFVGVTGRTLRRTNLQPHWRNGIEAAGLPARFRFHDLRHTGNTWAAATGANLRELMERMDHSRTRAARDLPPRSQRRRSLDRCRHRSLPASPAT